MIPSITQELNLVLVADHLPQAHVVHHADEYIGSKRLAGDARVQGFTAAVLVTNTRMHARARAHTHLP